MQTKGNSFKFRIQVRLLHTLNVNKICISLFYVTCTFLYDMSNIGNVTLDIHTFSKPFMKYILDSHNNLHVRFCHKICNNCRMKNATKISALPKHKKFKVKMVLQFILITFQSLRESLWSRRVLICDYYYVKIVTTKQETTVKATKHQTLACLLVSCWKNYFFLYLLMYFHVVMYF